MTELKITAVEGLRTQDETDAWEGFYSEEEEKQQKQAESQLAETKRENERYSDDFEGEDEKDRLDSNTNQEETTVVVEDNNQAETGNEQDIVSEEKRPKKGKVKKSKPHKNRHPSPSYAKPLKSRERSPPTHHRNSHNQENNRQRGRKLQRRRQMKNENLLEQVERSGRERLEQKYMELEELMSRPLGDTRGRPSRQRLQKMVNMQHRHAQNGHGEPEEGGEDHQAYSTIRVLQASGRNVQLKISYSPRSAHSPQSKLSHKPSTPQHGSRGSADSPTTSSSGRSPSAKENGFGGYTSEEEECKSSDEDGSPRRSYVPTDTFLKRTDNPKLREWIKRKDAEYRKARKAERIKKREERNDKMVEAELKIARREKSSERVKEWMETKRKEAILRQKAERQRRRKEAEEQKKRARSQESGLHGTRIDRPRTAPTQKSSYILIKRPNSAAKLDDGDGSNSKPPDTKFVYKRSVTGRVQLMKLQNERNARARSADEQRYDELSGEERQKKGRTSYDAWLLAKKKEELENKKAARRQKEAMKSDPEMERIIPELARRRIERIKNGKKTLDTGLRQSIASNGGEEAETQEAENQETESNGEPKPSSYQLTVNGVAATMATANKRPASARVRTPKPHKASSPPRPKSASAVRSSKKKANTVTETPADSQASQFKLPFPDELGVPYHVKRIQEKIFSKELTSQSDDGERPEPQGCAAIESATCPKGMNQKSKSEVTPQTSLVLLQEIEAEAIQSEQAEAATIIAMQKALEKAASTKSDDAGEEQEAQEAQESEQSTEEPGEEPILKLDEPDVDESEGKAEEDVEQDEQPEDVTENKEDVVEDPEQSAEETETGEAEEDEGEMKEENDGDEEEDEHQQEEEEEDAADDDAQCQEENPAEEEEQQAEETLIENEENAEDFTEEGEGPESTEPSSAVEEEESAETMVEDTEEQQATETAVEEDKEEQAIEMNVEEMKEEQATETTVEEMEDEQATEMTVDEEEESAEPVEEQTDSQPESPEDNPPDQQDTQESGDAEQADEDAELDDNLRRSEKHVSFSEELATVYESNTVEASSSFEDERGFAQDEKDAEQKTQ